MKKQNRIDFFLLIIADFSFPAENIVSRSHQYKQIGNSVSIPVIEAIAKQIKIALLN